MTARLRLPTALPRLLALAALLSLAACGGGGASDPASPPGGTAYVLVAASGDDIDDVAEDTGAVVLGPVPGTSMWRVQLPAGMTEAQFLALLDDDARVEEAEEDHELSTPEGGASTIAAGTTELAASIASQPELARIGRAAALARATGAGVRVAVVDTGIVASHPFLAASVDPDGRDVLDGDGDPTDAPDGVDDDGDGLVDEGFGHGTFVASLVLAVAPGARLLPVRVLGSDGQGTASALATGITWAVDRGVHVINVSIGMHASSSVVRRAVQRARSLGIVVVASAGNTGLEDATFPSAYSEVLAVTALGSGDVRAPFASYGGEVDLAAPGVDLLGAHPRYPSGVGRWSGTSFASALAAGAVALVKQLRPGLGAEDLQRVLQDRSVDVRAQNPGLDGELGAGRLDLDAATQP